MTITEIAKSGLLRAASCTPTTFSTALPAIATITSPANTSLMCSVWIAGVSAVTNQSDVKAAPTAAAPSTTVVVDTRPARRLVLLARGRLQEDRQGDNEDDEEHPRTDQRQRLLVRVGRGVEARAQRRDRHRRRGEQRECRDHPRAVGAEPLDPVAAARRR